MAGKGIRRGIYHAIHPYAKVNNKYMKDYDKNNKIIMSYQISYHIKSFQ